MASLRPDTNARRTHGQAMVEFALIMPILALLLVMAIDFGRVFFGWVAIHNAARIGADYAAGHADAWKGLEVEKQGERDNYQALVLGDLQALNCQLPSPDPVQDPNFAGFADGDLVEVRLECSFGLITPLAGAIVGQNVPLAATAQFAIYRTINASLPTPEPTPIPACGSPTASFTTSPAAGGSGRVSIANGVSVQFTDTSTAGSDCTVTSHSWVFGDGGTDNIPSPSHPFSYTGTGAFKDYTVVLTIQDSDGGTDNESIVVRVAKP